MAGVAAAVCLALGIAPPVQAHTTSIGYANSGNNAISFYYGTYHTGVETTYFEGQLHLVNTTGTFDQTVNFNILTGTKPTGLVDGDNNFYSGAISGLSGNEADVGGGRTILNWQGVTFTGLSPGTYTFTYVPIANPTQVWQPINDAILSNTVQIITADLSTAHRIGAGEVVDQTYSTDPMILDGGKERSTADGTLSQVVSITSRTGTFDTNGHDLTITGDIDGRGDLIKEGDGTLYLRGNNINTGDTVIHGGAVNVQNDAQLGDSSADIVLDGGSLQWDRSFDLDSHRSITLGSHGGTLDTQGYDTTVSQGIAGTGGLTKNGSGTLVLDGVNTYTGDTRVHGGDLVVGPAGALGHGALQVDGGAQASFNNAAQTVSSLAGAGDIALNGTTLALNGADNTSFSGALSGTGGLVKNGSGTQTLTGNNSYSGGTTINAGTLAISSDHNLGRAGDGLVLNGGTLATTGNVTSTRDLTVNGGSINVGGSTTFSSSGNVHGTGPLVKNGEGSLQLTGTLSHGGGTTVNEGTLVLSGNNTYTGGTVLNGGTLSISSDANLGATSGAVTFNGGNLTVTDSMTSQRDMIIAAGGGSITTANGATWVQQGAISGSGSLVKSGNGTLIVSGSNSFTGGTLIEGGTIRINSGSSLGTGDIILRGGFLETYATLGTGQRVVVSGDSGVNVASGTTTVLSGDIGTNGNTGCFVKSGAGSLSLTGHASLDKGTCVQSGTLHANGSIDSSFVNVDAIGALRGTGFISGPVNVTGRLAPGNSPGTLTVNGTVTMNAGSTFEADIDGMGTGTGAGNYSRLLITGAGHQFVANGTLEPLLRGITGDASNTFTPMLGDTFRIVTAEGGIVGRFSSLTQPAAGLPDNARFVAFYDMGGNHSIDLRVVPTSYGDIVGKQANKNALAVAGALDRTVDAQVTSGSAFLYGVSSLSGEHLADTVKAMAGEVHADQAASARGLGLAVHRDAMDHLDTDVSTGNKVWANLTQDGLRSVADAQGSGFSTSASQLTAGVDLLASESTVIGIGASHGESHVIATGGRGDIRGNAGLLYARQKAGAWVFDGLVARGSERWTTQRSDPFGGSSLDSRADGHSTTASLTARLPMQAGGARIEPYASVIWQKVQRDGASETGGSPAALTVDKLSQNGTRALLGLAAASQGNDPLAADLTWRVAVAAGADSGKLLAPVVRNHLAGETFETRAPDAGRGFVQVNAGGTARLSQHAYLYGGLVAEQGSGRAAYGVTAGVRVAF